MADLNLQKVGEDEAIRPIPARYLQLPTLIVQALRQYFGQTASRHLPGAAHLVYSGDRSVQAGDTLTSFLEILRLEEYRGDVAAMFPKLLVKRGAVGIKKPGIGNGTRMAVGQNAVDELRALDYAGSVTILAMSRVLGEAEFLAAEAEQLLNHFAQSLRRELQLRVFIASQVSDNGEIEEFPEYFAVPVVVDYIYEDNVKLQKVTFPIRTISLEIRSW